MWNRYLLTIMLINSWLNPQISEFRNFLKRVRVFLMTAEFHFVKYQKYFSWALTSSPLLYDILMLRQKKVRREKIASYKVGF